VRRAVRWAERANAAAREGGGVSVRRELDDAE
jgi:hypothetical protein